MRAQVQILTGDVLAPFVECVVRGRRRVRRITVVSPWLSHEPGSSDAVTCLLERAGRDDAAIIVVTRPSINEAHQAAIDAVRLYRRGSVFLNARLHAKLYVCEEGQGRGLVVIGSANMTNGSRGLDEVAVLMRPLDRGALISRLSPTIIQLAHGRGRRRSRRASAINNASRRREP